MVVVQKIDAAADDDIDDELDSWSIDDGDDETTTTTMMARGKESSVPIIPRVVSGLSTFYRFVTRDRTFFDVHKVQQARERRAHVTSGRKCGPRGRVRKEQEAGERFETLGPCDERPVRYGLGSRW
jgi:hypothetical protein